MSALGSTESYPPEHRLPQESGPAAFPEVTPTGDAPVDEVLQALASVHELSETDQHAAYERLHDDLLAELNTELD